MGQSLSGEQEREGPMLFVLVFSFQSDMYSVGIILLELFQPFGTEMERTEVLMGLRNAHFPLTFTAKWPVQAKYTKLLTCKASSQRPTAGQLLESELFHNTANVSFHLDPSFPYRHRIVSNILGPRKETDPHSEQALKVEPNSCEVVFQGTDILMSL